MRGDAHRAIDVFDPVKPKGLPRDWMAIGDEIARRDGERARGDYFATLIDAHASAISRELHLIDTWPELVEQRGGAVYRILRLLVSNPGRTMSLADIGAAASGNWVGDVEDRAVGTLRVQMYRTRAILAPHRGRIVTMNDEGYRFIPASGVPASDLGR